MALMVPRPADDTSVVLHVPPRKAVPAIERAAAVLERLAATSEPLTLADLSKQVSMARSSLHDVCASLVATGLAEKSPSGRYQIGLKVVELARRRLASTDLVSTFQAVCRAHGSQAETVVLSVLSGSDVVYVSFIDGGRPLAVRYEIGMRLPAAFTASGKAILSTLPTAKVESLLGPHVDNRNGWGQRKSLPQLVQELHATRERGYSIDDEETARGMTCIGAAVFADDHSQAVGAVAMSLVKGSTTWFDTQLSDYIRQLAAEISRRMGASGA
jgi:DNA-binding IclR family transcriptional regulator